MTEKVDYKNEIKKLISLQELDSEIYDLRIKKGSYPERIQEMDDSLESKKEGLHAAEENLKSLLVRKSERETDMQVKEELIQKHDSELYQIKNNKEYQALQLEIDGIKADVSIIEEEIIKLFDEIEAAQTKVEDEKKIFEQEKQEVEKEKNTIKAEEQQLDDRLAELGSKRETSAGSADPEVLARYERILSKSGRAAIAKVTDESCGECNIHLRPQSINEAQIQKALSFCESCGRILYVEE